ncbi:MAG: hypothetical protein Q8N55_04225 [bacterium]|nr:hypothetical protein [bacterium]
MAIKSQEQNISIPQKLFLSILEAHENWQKLTDDLSDFFASSDGGFLKKMRQARSEHLAGKLKDLSALKEQL